MSKFQSDRIKAYEAKGYIVLKTIRLNKSGFPDLFILKPGGEIFFEEIKEGKDTLKQLQKYRIDQLNNMGFKATCVHNTKGVIYPKEKSKQNEGLEF